MERENIKIEDLGYDDFFESDRVKNGLDIFEVARVIAQYKGAYKVKDIDGEYLAKITGKQIFKAFSREDYPAVGDWVAISKTGEKEAIIHGILQRKTIIKRKHSGRNETQVIAANIDVAFVIEAVDRDYNLNRIERYFAIARDGGIEPAVILNKIDLISQEELDLRLNEIKNRLGEVKFIPTSTLTKEGLEELKKYIVKRKTYCFLGSSGVGKSSLINKLLGEEIIRTEEIGTHSERGRHTTTTREMYFLAEGGIVIDNPGVREVGIMNAQAGITSSFDEIVSLAKNCKYVDCTHLHEPDCAVLLAVESGKLDKDEYANYINLKKESDHYEMTEIEKRGKDKKFGKFFKNAKKDFKRYGHKDY